MDTDLTGKVALVTGGSRGIGRAIALGFARAGAQVVVASRKQAGVDAVAAEIRQLGGTALEIAAHLGDDQAIEARVENALAAFGRIDVLVNNAYWAAHHPFHEIPEEVWDRTLDVCLKGYFLCGQQAARAMIDQGDGGCIVNISSVHAHRVWPGDTSYGVAKAGINRLTQTMAVDLGPHRIRCNAVQPGYVDTHRAFGDPAPEYGSAPPHLHSFIPLRRHTTPEDIGRAVVFLCSPAGACISGVSLPLDGGLLATGVPG